MKIIHTSDWHIGKIVNEFSMIEDQKYILDELLQLTDKEEAKVIIIAGDIYDRSIPPVEAVELLNKTLSTLILDKNIKVLMISGNHDGGERLSFGSDLLEKAGLYISGNDDEVYKKVTLIENNVKVNFYLVPYKDPVLTKRLLKNKEIRNHNDAMEAVISQIKETLDKNEVNILVGHGYMTTRRDDTIGMNQDIYEKTELEISESERPLSIGGTDLIDASLFDEFDYVALGHLHGRQKIGRKEMRYSGTLLKYSFSEVNHKKGVTILDIKEKNHIDIKSKELKPLRDLRIVRGNLDDIIEFGRNVDIGKDDYIQAILTDDGELMNPMEKLRSVYPNTMLITRERKREYNKDKTSAKGEYKSKSKLDLFKEFYQDLGNGEYTADKESVLINTINSVLKKEVE
ncbi:MAG: exonuclease SbcCD subunit D [Peptostreptococcaceae bacterium]